MNHKWLNHPHFAYGFYNRLIPPHVVGAFYFSDGQYCLQRKLFCLHFKTQFHFIHVHIPSFCCFATFSPRTFGIVASDSARSSVTKWSFDMSLLNAVTTKNSLSSQMRALRTSTFRFSLSRR